MEGFKAIPVLLLSCISFFSCIEEIEVIDDNAEVEVVQANPSVKTRSAANETIYTRLPNPYALEVMQKVYDDNSMTKVTLEPTDLYVKFMPKDSIELHQLMFDYGLELFEYPLDIELAEGEEYVNEELPETDLAWFYTTVPPDYDFPPIAYEILQECYIPEDGESIVQTKAGAAVSVEAAAFTLSGYTEQPPVQTKASSRPSGTVRFENEGSYMPLKGVKVRCNTIVKWASAYTDENGEYVMNKKFYVNPIYAVVFDNVKGFDIWGSWVPCFTARHCFGIHNKSGFSMNFGSNHKRWDCAAVNNSAYEYYKMCETTGIPKPPETLKIWIWKNFTASSAPMLRRIEHVIGYSGKSGFLNYFINVYLGYGMTATILNQMLKFVLPDITIGTKGKDYAGIFEHVNHELSHASHFSQVGSEFWAQYVSYIMTYGAYGDGTGNKAELCGIGEMWGFFMGYKLTDEKFSINDDDCPPIQYEWICPQVFWDIEKSGVLTKKQIYDCLQPDVRTYNQLVSKMYSLYPDRVTDITEILEGHAEFKYNVSVPDVEYDAFLVSRTVTSDELISGTNILVQNSTVKSGASLVINAGNSITINKPFVLERGSSFTVNLPN